MAVNWYNQTLPADPATSRVIPPAVRAKLLADQMVMQQASSTEAPIYSPAGGWAKIAAGALGGYLHSKELTDLQNRQAQSMASAIPAYPGDAAQPAPAQDASPAQSPSPASAADATPAAVASSAAPASPPSGFTPPPMSAPQLASVLDPSKGWADPGNVPTIGAPVPGLSPGAPAPSIPDSATALSPLASPSPTVAPVPAAAAPGPAPAPLPSPAVPTMAASPPSPTPAPPPPATAQPPSAPSTVIRGTPMDRATYEHYAKMAQDPNLPAEYQQQAMQMLLPHQIPRSDGSIVMYDPVRGVGQTIVPPSPEYAPLGDTGLTFDKHNVRTLAPGQAQGSQLPGNQPGGQGFQLNRPMTPQEKEAASIAPDYPAFVNTITGKPTFGQPGTNINVGGDQDAQKKFTDAMIKEPTALVNGIDGARQQISDLNGMKVALDQIKANGGISGFGQEKLNELKSGLTTVAHAFGVDPDFDLANPDSVGKFSRSLATAQAKSLLESGGGRLTNLEFANFLKSNPNLEMSPGGNERLIGLMQQNAQRQYDLGQQLMMWGANWKAAHPDKPYDIAQMHGIITSYDAAHPLIDPLTGKNLSASTSGPAPAAQPPPGGAPAPPKVGEVQDGHRYNGGDPGNPASWSPAP